jgi:hypothetical protein
VLVTALQALFSLVSTLIRLLPLTHTNFTTEGQKSTGQKVGDTVRGGSDDASQQGEGVLKQAQDGLSNAASSVQNALGGGNKQ